MSSIHNPSARPSWRSQLRRRNFVFLRSKSWQNPKAGLSQQVRWLANLKSYSNPRAKMRRSLRIARTRIFRRRCGIWSVIAVVRKPATPQLRDLSQRPRRNGDYRYGPCFPKIERALAVALFVTRLEPLYLRFPGVIFVPDKPRIRSGAAASDLRALGIKCNTLTKNPDARGRLLVKDRIGAVCTL